MSDPNDGVLYSYANVGTFSSPAWLGRVVGFTGRVLVGVMYCYANVLTYISGEGRVTEGGDVRVTEDGNRRVVE